MENGIREEARVKKRLVDLEVVACVSRGRKSGLRQLQSQWYNSACRERTFHVVIRLNFPIGVMQFSIHASSAWCRFCSKTKCMGTRSRSHTSVCLTSSWWKMIDRFGSRPTARRTASMSRRAALNAFGSCGNVRACQPTMEYMSWSSGAASRCSFTQFNRAPRRFPSCSRQCEYFLNRASSANVHEVCL